MDQEGSFFDRLEVKRRVYDALILRYVVTRHGRGNVGFLWIVLEPMILCVGVLIIWSLTKGTMEHGLQLSAVVFTGYMPLTLWRHMSNSMAYILRVNKSASHFRQISQLDIILARLFLEFFSVTAATMVIYFVLSQLNLILEFYSLSDLLIGWLIMAALGFGGGMIVAGMTEASEISEKFIPPFQYLMLPLSGCFFFLDWLPPGAREYISYVPFVHSFEIFRAGLFGPSIVTHGNALYGFACALIMTGVGFFLFDRVKDHIEP